MILFDFGGWAAAHEDVPYVYDATYVLVLSLYGITGWAWTLAALNLGIRARFMQRPLPFLANQAVLPIYVLHLPIVLGISFVVVGWPIGLVPNAVLIVGLGVGITVVVTMAALRMPIPRSLLGARHRRRRTAVPAVAA